MQIPLSRPRIAVIGTGGTIASLGESPLELTEYANHGRVEDVHALLARFPLTQQMVDVVPVPYATLASPAIGPSHWLELVERIHAVCETDAVDGVVLTHGTATLEETAYFLNLTLKVSVPVVVVGAQRPATGLSTDAALNLLNACRVAGCPQARGLGVLVVLNDEIHAAREVSKTSTQRVQTFRAPDFGCLGHADSDTIAFYRRPVRRHAPDTEFNVGDAVALPRVDIIMSYAGADGVPIDALVAAGAKGLVAAGFAPGFTTPGQLQAFNRAAAAGVHIVQCTRVGSGRVAPLAVAQPTGCVTADNLTPQKARILLMLGLLGETDRERLQALFDTY